jgi:hypothetical protein
MSDFSVIAAKEGIEDLTAEEYQKFVVDKPKVSAAGQVRLIAGHRRDNADKTTETVDGYSIGAFDFTTTKTSWSSTKSQMVKIWTGDGVREALNRGTYIGHHGREVRLEISNKEDSPFWMVEEVTGKQRQLDPKKLPWQDIMTLMNYRGPADGDYPTMFITGEISGVYNVKNLDGEKDDDGRYPDWGIAKAPPIPTCSVLLRAEQPLSTDHLQILQCYVNFGPHKHAIPWIKGLPDFQLEGIDTSRELGDIMKGQKVGVIAVRPQVKDGETKEGHDVKKIYLKGIALISLDAIPASAISEAVTAPAPAVATTPDAAPALERLNELKGKIRSGLAFIPYEEATPDKFKKAGYIESFWPDELVTMAIQTVADEENAAAVAQQQTVSEIHDTASEIVAATQSPVAIVPPDQFESKEVRKITRLLKKHEGDKGADLDFVLNAAKTAGIEEKTAEEIIEWLLDAGHASEPVVGMVKLA